MINPFFYPPQHIPSKESALYVEGLYDLGIAASVAQAKASRERLDAIADVLKQNHPDLSPDLDLLIEAARIVGHLEGTREDSDIVKSQFRAYLPNAIRKALEQPSQ
jgi:hypothetical protein